MQFSALSLGGSPAQERHAQRSSVVSRVEKYALFSNFYATFSDKEEQCNV
jgi:hypothetical protein